MRNHEKTFESIDTQFLGTVTGGVRFESQGQIIECTGSDPRYQLCRPVGQVPPPDYHYNG